MSEPREIIHVVKKMDRGGVETWLMNVLRNIDREHFHFTFCTTDEKAGAFDVEIRSLGADIIACPLAGGYQEFARRFRSILEKKKPDVVHSHMLLFSGIVLRNAAKARIPIRIAHAHNTHDARPDSVKRHMYRWLMRRYIKKYATNGIGCSRAAADYLFGLDWKKWKGCRVDVATCAIDTSVFATAVDNAKLRKSLGISPSVKIIGHVGGFRRQKNHEFLLHIFAAMLQKRRDIHLLLVGDGPLRTKIGELAKQLGITQRVTFMGVRDDVPLLIKGLFDLLVFPSRFEGLGLVVVESQAAGVHCLISDVVPIEATVIEELVKRESLKVGVGVWAERALEILKQPPCDKAEALEQIEKSKFGISASVEFLSDLYSGKLSL